MLFFQQHPQAFCRTVQALADSSGLHAEHPGNFPGRAPVKIILHHDPGIRLTERSHAVKQDLPDRSRFCTGGNVLPGMRLRCMLIVQGNRRAVRSKLPEAADVELEEAPQTEEYVPNFKDEELERIKEESKKPQRYVPPPMELTEEKKKENIRIMNELREEREREKAKKGFVTLIILTVVGVIGAACFSIYLAGLFGLGYKPEVAESWMSKVTSFAPIIGVVMGVTALVLAAPIPQLKGITKFAFVIGFILSLFPGIPLLSQKEGHGGVNGLLLALSAICCLAVVVVLSVSDGVNMYNKHGSK